MNTIQDYLAGPVLSELTAVEQQKVGIPWRLPKEFLTSAPESRVVGMEVRYTAWRGTRKSMQLVDQASPSAGINLPGERTIIQSGLGGKENFTVGMELLKNLQSDVPYIRMHAEAAFKRLISNRASRMETLRRNLTASVLLTGQISWKKAPNGESQITTAANGSGQCSFSPITLNQGANTISVTNDEGDTINYTITVPDFSNAATDIPGFFRNLNQLYEQITGFSMRHVLYGLNTPSYLGVNNTSMGAYWSRNQSYGTKFMDTAEVPTNLFSVGGEGGELNLRWSPAYMQWFQDPLANNAATPWVGAKQMVIIPEVDTTWFEQMECGTAIPKGFAVMDGSDLDGIVKNATEIAFGSFGYAYPILDPYSVRSIVGWYGLPVIKNGLVQWIINLAP